MEYNNTFNVYMYLCIYVYYIYIHKWQLINLVYETE